MFVRHKTNKMKFRTAVLFNICFFGFILPSNVLNGQHDKNLPLRSSSVGLDFNCSFDNCNFQLKGHFLDDVPTLRNDDDLEWYSDLGFDIDVQSVTSPGTGFPVAYASGQILSINVAFESVCQGLPSTIGVRGISSTGYHFPALQLNVTTANQTGTTGLSSFVYESEASSEKNTFVAKPLPPGVVDLIDLDIKWQINIGDWNDEAEWKEVAVTNNRIYVTLNPAFVEELNPASGPPNYNPYYYHTDSGFFVGCNAAKGSANEENVIQKVWEAFQDASLMNSQGEGLSYYNGWIAENYTGANQLVQYRNGQCTAWALFFLTVLKNMGVQTGLEWKYISLVSANHIYFLVKDWGDANPLPSSVANALANNDPIAADLIAMGYQNIIILKGGDVQISNNAYDFHYSDITDEPGIPGQNSGNPQSIFGFHEISAVSGNIYDASYGSPYSNANFIKDFQDAALFGVMQIRTISISESNLGLDINGDGFLSTYPVDRSIGFVKKYNSTAGDIFLEVFSTSQF